MRSVIRPVATALTIASLSVSFAAISTQSASAQAAKQAPAKQTAPAKQAAPEPPPAAKQIALTDKQLEAVLASQKDFDDFSAKLQPAKGDAGPNAAVIAQLNDLAKKHGFADYAEYNVVLDNIGLVMTGFDPKTKVYVGAEAVIRQQIAAVQADKKMPAADKKAALADLNAGLKTPPPAIENKGNIDLVGKYYDKLAAIMQDEQ